MQKYLMSSRTTEPCCDHALKEKFGSAAREEDVTDASDFVCFFPSLTSEVLSIALRRELEHPAGAMENFQKVRRRIEELGFSARTLVAADHSSKTG